MKYRHQTGSGSVEVEMVGHCLLASFKGQICRRLAQFFLDKIEICVIESGVTHWGYLSHSESAEAATPDAYEIFAKAAITCRMLGAVCDAYVLKSPLAIHQMDKVRKELGAPGSIEDVLFETDEQAMEFINKAVERVSS